MLKWMTRAVLDCYVQFVQKFNKLRSCLVKKLKLRLFFFLSSFFFFKVTQYWTKASQALKTYKVVLQLTYVGHLTGVIWCLCQLRYVFFSLYFSVCVFSSHFLWCSLSHGDFSCTYIRDSVWLIDVISYQVNSYHNVAYTVCATANLQLGFSQQC